MKPGIYEGLPYKEYRAADGINVSNLHWIEKSPIHWKWHMENESKPTAAMRFGTAFHTYMLERERYEQDVKVCNSNASSKAYKKIAEDYPDATIITGQNDADIKLMAKNIDYPLQGGRAELSIFWNDPLTGLLCKSRVDYQHKDKRITDVKTTACAEEDAFRKSIKTFGYHVQGAFITQGMICLGEEVNEYWLLAAEKEPPFCNAAYMLSQDSIELGGVIFRDRLNKIHQCYETQSWGGYEGGEISV